MATKRGRRRENGQVVVIFAAASTVLLLLAGLVIDGGYAFAQRRSVQTTADLAALGAARVMASYVSGDTVNGTDDNVRLSIDRTLAANGEQPIDYGAPDPDTGKPGGPRYVDINGSLLGYVGAGIPPTAVGVQVPASRSWRPFFLGLIGVSNWDAGATATARGGYRAGGAPASNLLPIGVSLETYEDFPICPAGIPAADCTEVALTEHEGNGHLPGGPGFFGWLKFGCGDDVDDSGNPYDLGQNNLGCEENKPFLVGQWGDLSANPPVMPKSYGCCGPIGQEESGDDIGQLPGNKASVDNTTPGVAYYINNGMVGFVPLYDYLEGNGSGGYFHIVGYAGFQLVSVDGAKNIRGILRQLIFPGPITTTAPNFAGAPLAVQLIQ
jgi:hypothetical protein